MEYLNTVPPCIYEFYKFKKAAPRSPVTPKSLLHLKDENSPFESTSQPKSMQPSHSINRSAHAGLFLLFFGGGGAPAVPSGTRTQEPVVSQSVSQSRKARAGLTASRS